MRSLGARARAAGTCLLVLLHASACSVDEAPRRRALLIGIDGASFTVARPLMAEGRLPNLSRIEQEGVSGPLRSFFPLLSPRIWTSMATGRKVEDHGIEGWVHLDERKRPHLYSSLDRRSHALWNILARYGRRVGVVNWLMTQPPEKINGVMVSDHAAPGMAGNQRDLADLFAKRQFADAQGEVQVPGAGRPYAYPPAWFERVARARGNTEPLTSIPSPFANDAASAGPVIGAMLERTYENDRFATRVALEIEAELDPDLLMVYLPGIDRVSHFLWADLETEALEREGTPGRTVAMARGGAEGLRRYYEFTDALIGRLVERYAADDLVWIVSDHGFETLTAATGRIGGHESEAARDGVLLARGAGLPRGEHAVDVSVLDVAPTLLTWLGLPVALDMPGRPASFVPGSDVPPVATHDVGEIERTGRIEDEVEADIIDQLRKLGYVE